MGDEDTRDDTWYIAIIRGGSSHYPLTAVCGESYRDFSRHAAKNGMNIVAERFGISDLEINLLTGFSREGKRTGEIPQLTALAIKLDSEGAPNAQEELNKLCDQLPK